MIAPLTVGIVTMLWGLYFDVHLRFALGRYQAISANI